jgi:hypothetical protein
MDNREKSGSGQSHTIPGPDFHLIIRLAPFGIPKMLPQTFASSQFIFLNNLKSYEDFHDSKLPGNASEPNKSDLLPQMFKKCNF